MRRLRNGSDPGGLPNRNNVLLFVGTGSSRNGGYRMSVYPPYMVAAYDRGRELNRCRNEGCGRMWEPDKNDPRILRCPHSCTMKRAATVEVLQFELDRQAEAERARRDRASRTVAAE